MNNCKNFPVSKEMFEDELKIKIRRRFQNYINKGRRNIVHYPFNDQLTKEMEYQSKGFVSSSFIKGLEPEENWNHSITGRE